MAAAFSVLRGEGPVLVHVPHAGLLIPEDVRDELLLGDAELDTELMRMTDHGTAELAQGAVELGATVLVNRTSRLVVDVERYPDRDAEEMELVGMGAVYTRTSGQDPLRDEEPVRRDVVRHDLLGRFHAPWHTALDAEVSRLRALHGSCTIVDLHSYPSRALPYELRPDTPRPEVCVGTDPRATPEPLARLLETILADHGLASARDTPFSGALTPAGHAGDPSVASIMVEVRRDVICDEATGRVHAGVADVRAAVHELVAGLAVTRV